MSKHRVLSIVVVLLFSGCFQRQANQVKFVLPDHSEGVFVVEENESGGVPDVKGDEITLRIPINGKLLLSDTTFLTRWHSWRVFYQNGTEIDALFDPHDVSGTNIRCWALFSTSKRDYWFAGTTADRNSIRNLPESQLGPFFLRQRTDRDR